MKRKSSFAIIISRHDYYYVLRRFRYLAFALRVLPCSEVKTYLIEKLGRLCSDFEFTFDYESNN